MNSLGGGGQSSLSEQPSGARKSNRRDDSAVNESQSWESRYQNKLHEKEELLRDIRHLERQNHLNEHHIEKERNSEQEGHLLKQLTEDLRVWKSKVAKLKLTLEKEEQKQKNQKDNTQRIKEENARLESQIQQGESEAQQQREKWESKRANKDSKTASFIEHSENLKKELNDAFQEQKQRERKQLLQIKELQ